MDQKLGGPGMKFLSKGRCSLWSPYLELSNVEFVTDSWSEALSFGWSSRLQPDMVSLVARRNLGQKRNNQLTKPTVTRIIKCNKTCESLKNPSKGLKAEEVT